MLKKGLFILLGIFVLLAFAKTQGCFDDGLSYVAINHGNHKHYLPKERDEGIGMDNCPTQQPQPNELLSRQCQLLRLVVQNNVTYYVPAQVGEGVDVTLFPTEPPGAFQQITPTGQIVSVQ